MDKECALCKKDLETTFLDKIKGTSIKIGNAQTAKTFWVCNVCQKEHQENVKKVLEK